MKSELQGCYLRIRQSYRGAAYSSRSRKRQKTHGSLS